MEKSIISTPKAPDAIGPYSQGWIAGSMVYTSGQVPVDPASGEIPSGPVIYGTEGTIAADRHSSKVRVYRGASHGFTQPDEVYDTVSEDNIGRNFLDHLEKGTPLFELIEPAFNLKVQAALDAGIRSCESGRAEPVQNPFEEDFT